MLKRDLIMVQIEELGKMIAQVIFNRNNNAAGKNPELIQTVYENLKLTSDFLMTTAPDDILRFLDNEEKSGVLRLEIAIKTLIEDSYQQPKNQPDMLVRAKELLEYLQAHDTTFSLERVNLMNEIEKLRSSCR
ncbi:hypothetical protein HMPREF1536_04407 [Parabacteroides gordonii MS-1 = DSM 23371]|uniref:Uncharacterized protein n=2 Tax=Parabacteroides gordonii TaxID=574930 RepID=A0A0F5IUZ5_9BACT|nr:hypothetical protein HMPREF1536_04407 [Parabacteroides gordonii MS-1 = DSM 23371]